MTPLVGSRLSSVEIYCSLSLAECVSDRVGQGELRTRVVDEIMNEVFGTGK